MGEETKHFEEINAKRINIVDDNGTIRMALTNKDHFPPPLSYEGKELPREMGSNAGIIFYMMTVLNAVV